MKWLLVLLLSLSAFSAEKKTLKVFVGIEGYQQRPFSDWKLNDPEPAGIDPDLLRLVAKEMAVKLSFYKINLKVDWEDIRPELLNGDFVDVVAYCYTVTEERKKRFLSAYLITNLLWAL